MHTLPNFIKSKKREFSGGFIRLGNLKPNKKSKFYQNIVILDYEPEVIPKGKKRDNKKTG